MNQSTDEEVVQLRKEIDSPILSIPFIDFALGSIILPKIRDIHNFKSPNQLRAYTGYEAFVSSARKNQIASKIKPTYSQLRWALHGEAIWIKSFLKENISMSQLVIL